MPGVVGSPYSQAVITLRRYDLPAPQVSYEHSQQPRDVVVRQDPREGQPLGPSTRPTVVLSDGVPPAGNELEELAAQVLLSILKQASQTPPPSAAPTGSRRQPVMPYVIGSQVNDAREAIRKARLPRPRTETKASSKPRGEVVEQSPQAGQPVARETPVRIALSDGTLVSVPQIVDRSPEEARVALQDADLQLGDRFAAVVSANVGRIVTSDPPYQAEVRRRTRVNYAVGVEPTKPERDRTTTRPTDPAPAAGPQPEPPARASTPVETAQAPRPGRSPGRPGAFTLRPVRDPPPVLRVPDVTGMTEARAVAELRGAGLNANIAPRLLGRWETSVVKRQAPGSGAEAMPGDTVRLMMQTAVPPVFLAQTALVAILAMGAWSLAWPSRITLRPGSFTDARFASTCDEVIDSQVLTRWAFSPASSPPTAAIEGQLDQGLEVRVRWDMDVADHGRAGDEPSASPPATVERTDA